MLKCLKKAFFNHSSFKGFSLIELVIGILITMVIGAAMMEGISYYRSEMLSINIKEKAYSELINFTIFWKSQIATNKWHGDNIDWYFEPDRVGLFTSELEGVEGDEEEEWIEGTLSYRAEKQERKGNIDYYFYTLETRIMWPYPDFSDTLTFLVDQLVFYTE